MHRPDGDGALTAIARGSGSGRDNFLPSSDDGSMTKILSRPSLFE